MKYRVERLSFLQFLGAAVLGGATVLTLAALFLFVARWLGMGRP